MRLTYQTPPEPGTIVVHNQGEPELFKRFLAVATEDGTLRQADPRTEVYVAAMPGKEPRSIVEWHILRRTWTPYGYAKVWGETPECGPPPSDAPANPREHLKQINADMVRKAEECAHWYRKRHPSLVDDMKSGKPYIKTVNKMWKNMRDNG